MRRGQQAQQRPVLRVDRGVDDVAVAHRLRVRPGRREEVLVELLEALRVAVAAVRAGELRIAIELRAVRGHVARDQRERAQEGRRLRHLAVRADVQLRGDLRLRQEVAHDHHRLGVLGLQQADHARERRRSAPGAGRGAWAASVRLPVLDLGVQVRHEQARLRARVALLGGGVVQILDVLLRDLGALEAQAALRVVRRHRRRRCAWRRWGRPA